MEKIFISSLAIENVRHLKNITIPLSDEEPRHLILTGKNGSGKTSVLEALSRKLNADVASDETAGIPVVIEHLGKHSEMSGRSENVRPDKWKKGVDWIMYLPEKGIVLEFNKPIHIIQDCFQRGKLILAYYKAERSFEAEIPKHVEKIELKDNYKTTETPRQLFIKYLVDLKVTEALSRNSGKSEKADGISLWFVKFQELLRKIFDDSSLELLFEEDTFAFSIKERDKEIFDFNTLSDGFSAVLDIVLDLMMRMEKITQRTFDFHVPGIVLIDEVETHLHLELQKTILDLLTTIFPNIQFIMSTHSPFVLNSLSNAVIYDLEKKIIVEDGLSNVPYGGIVEGYFRSDQMSESLKKKFERYRELVKKNTLSDEDFEEIARLEMFLNDIPDYLALDITTEYQRLKLELESREDV